jgi:hypothetical protein
MFRGSLGGSLGAAGGALAGGALEVQTTRKEANDVFNAVLDHSKDEYIQEIKDRISKESDKDLMGRYFDTFRHAYAAAINQNDLGFNSTIFLGNVREIGTIRSDDQNRSLEAIKDAYNNIKGAQIGRDMMRKNSNTTRYELAETVLKDIDEGKLPIRGRDEELLRDKSTLEYIATNTPLIPRSWIMGGDEK